MTRGSRGLCGFYVLTALWLAWCTVTLWGRDPTWVSLLNVAASLVACIAVVREATLKDERRTVARLIAQATRRTTWDEPLPADGQPLDAAEAAEFEEIAAHWDDRSAA